MYIAIAGNIGSGKTTLTQILTKRYDAKCYLEECDNPYIGDFYEDMNRWAFNLQISFLGSRIQQTMDMISDCKSGVIFQDRTIYEDAHIFADNLHEMGLMATRDIETYMKIFRLVTTLIPKPDLLIYLKASVPTLISQIRKRGREYEMNIDELYLKRLNNKYNHWIDTIYEGEVLVVDKDHEDFVSNPAVLERICARLERAQSEEIAHDAACEIRGAGPARPRRDGGRGPLRGARRGAAGIGAAEPCQDRGGHASRRT